MSVEADRLLKAADRLAETAAHIPGPNDDGLRYCETCKYGWPCPPVDACTVAIIEVWHGGPDSKSWPIAEKVPGGWQSGENHYSDAMVAEVTPYYGPWPLVKALSAMLALYADCADRINWVAPEVTAVADAVLAGKAVTA